MNKNLSDHILSCNAVQLRLISNFRAFLSLIAAFLNEQNKESIEELSGLQKEIMNDERLVCTFYDKLLSVFQHENYTSTYVENIQEELQSLKLDQFDTHFLSENLLKMYNISLQGSESESYILEQLEEESNEEICRQYELQKTENDELRQQLSQLKLSSSDVVKAREAYEQLQNNYLSLEGSFNEKQQLIEQNEAEISTLEAYVVEVNKENKQLKSSIDVLNSQIRENAANLATGQPREDPDYLALEKKNEEPLESALQPLKQSFELFGINEQNTSALNSAIVAQNVEIQQIKQRLHEIYQNSLQIDEKVQECMSEE